MVLFNTFKSKKNESKTEIKGGCQSWHFEGPFNMHLQSGSSLLTHFTLKSVASLKICMSLCLFENLDLTTTQDLPRVP